MTTEFRFRVDNPSPESPDSPATQSKEEEPSEKPTTVAAPVPTGDSDEAEEEDEEEDGDEDDFGDDFDDFEEGNEDDDFDDFEDGFQQAEAPAPVPTQGTLPQQPTLPFVSFLEITLGQIVNSSCSLYPTLTDLTPKEL